MTGIHCQVNAVTVHQLQLLVEADSNLRQIDGARVLLMDAVNGRIMFQHRSNAVVQFADGVLLVGHNVCLGQQVGHGVLLQPCQPLAKVLILGVQAAEYACAGAMLEPFVAPKGCVRFACGREQKFPV